MFAQIDKIITAIDNAVWGLPLICLIMATGIFLTVRLVLYRSDILESFQIHV